MAVKYYSNCYHLKETDSMQLKHSDLHHKLATVRQILALLISSVKANRALCLAVDKVVYCAWPSEGICNNAQLRMQVCFCFFF